MKTKKISFTLAIALIINGCGTSSYFAEPTTTTSEPTTLSCSTKVIDYGLKSSTFTRGATSDVKLIPGSNYPAIVYSDAGALSIKAAYWNGSEYKNEVISGDTGVTAIRMVILSTGIPWVFWLSNGAYVKGAVRSASFGSSGTWSAGVLDSGTAPAVLEVSANPLNQIGIMYLTDVAVTGRPKFLYCSTCTTPSSFVSMSSTTYIEDTNVVLNETGVGMAWCKSSDSVYYPAVTYAVTGTVNYAVCQQSDLSNCTSGSNWSTQQVVASGNVNSKLYLDPTVTGDVPKVVSFDASGMTPYRMGSTACTAAVGAFSAGTAMGGATSGSKSMNILKDSAGRFHLVANESTTSIRYYNSTSTDFLGTWNGAGTIATVTIPNPGWMGSAINDATNGLFISYGITSGLSDVRLAKINDYLFASDSASLTVSKFQIDNTGNINLNASPKKNIRMATTSAGIPATAYIDYSQANSILKYSIRQGTNASDEWVSCILPDAQTPQTPSIAFDSSDHPWIGYFDTTTARFYLATTFSTQCGGPWISYEFPATPSGAQANLPATNDTATVMYKTSSAEYPMLIALDTNAGSKGIRSAYLNPATSEWSSVATVSSLGASTAANLTADADDNGNVVLGYYDLTVTRAKYAKSDDGLTWSTPFSVTGLGQGTGLRIRLRPSTGKPVMTYFDRAGNTVYYASCSGSLTDCTTGGWLPTALDSSTGVSGLASAQDQLLSTATIFSNTDVPYVLYPRGKSSDGNLLAVGLGSTTTSSQVISYGTNVSLADTPAYNYGVAGWALSAVPNAAGFFTTLYVGPGDWLYATSCGD